jgi:hypothetical protein
MDIATMNIAKDIATVLSLKLGRQTSTQIGTQPFHLRLVFLAYIDLGFLTFLGRSSLGGSRTHFRSVHSAWEAEND